MTNDQDKRPGDGTHRATPTIVTPRLRSGTRGAVTGNFRKSP